MVHCSQLRPNRVRCEQIDARVVGASWLGGASPKVEALIDARRVATRTHRAGRKPYAV